MPFTAPLSLSDIFEALSLISRVLALQHLPSKASILSISNLKHLSSRCRRKPSSLHDSSVCYFPLAVNLALCIHGLRASYGLLVHDDHVHPFIHRPD